MAQTINLGKLRLDWRGDFNPSASYVTNDVVTYRQQQWVCTQPTQAASFVGSQTGTTLTVTTVNPITPTTGVSIISTVAGTTVTVASTLGLQTGNTFVVSGNAGGGLTATTYFVGSVLSSTTLTLASTYANAVAGTFLTFTANTFGSLSVGTPINTGTTYVAYGSLAVGQIISGSNSPIVITNATGTGSIATLTFVLQASAPFITGSTIVVQGLTPFGYNGSFVVVNCTTTQVTYANTTTATLQSGSSGTVNSVTAVNTITAAAVGNGAGSYTVSTSVANPTGSINWTSVFASAIPAASNSYWSVFTQMFNNQGTWTNGQTYAVGDIVLYSTPGILQNLPTTVLSNYSLSRSVVQAFYCVAAHTASNTGTNITPADPNYWTPVNRKGILGSQAAPNSLYDNYQLGVYSNQNYSSLVFPNRGIAFDNSPNYYGGSTKNTTDSPTFGYVTANGQVMNWGMDVSGSLGVPSANQGTGSTNNSAENSLTFPFYDFWRSTSNSGSGVHSTPDGGIPRVIQWEKGYDRNLVLMNSGEVFSWGNGQFGENGDGSNTTSRAYPVRVGGPLASVYANTAPTGTAYANGTRITAGHSFYNIRIKRISMSGGCGSPTTTHHCLAIDESGNLWMWGNNTNGQLGMNAIDPGATQQTTYQAWPQQMPRSAFYTASAPAGQSVVACWACGAGPQGWSYAVTQDGNLWAWGYNASGQLGTGNTATQYAPNLISSVTGTANTYFGSGAIGAIQKIQVLDDSSGTTYACVAILTSTNQIFVVGNNGSGWMGTTPGSNVVSWTNISGGPGTQGNSAAKDFWLYGTGGRYATCMQRDKNTGFCWVAGYNAYGQLGPGNTSTTSSSTFSLTKMNVSGTAYTLVNVKQLAFSANTTYCSATVVLDNGMGFSIGNNYFGQTSIGYSSNSIGVTGNNYTGGQGTAVTAPALGGTFASEPNGIELVSSYVWQPMRTPPGMQGNLADCMGYNYDTSSFWLMWVNNDGRVMLAGSYGVSGQYFNPWGQIRVVGGSTAGTKSLAHTETMTMPITD